MKRAASQQGFLKLVIFIIVVVLILGYFNIDLKKTIETPTNKDNAEYVKGHATTIWTKYLEKPAHYLWNTVFVNLLWKEFIENMNRVKDGEPTIFETMSPQVAPAVPPAPSPKTGAAN